MLVTGIGEGFTTARASYCTVQALCVLALRLTPLKFVLNRQAPTLMNIEQTMRTLDTKFLLVDVIG